MRRFAFIFCHLVILAVAFWRSSSATGFFVTGCGLALLVDRYATGVLPWRRPVNWSKEVGLPAGSFLFAATAFYFMRPGVVPLWEAAYRGLIASLVVFLGEAFVGLLIRVTGRPAWLFRVALGCLIGVAVPAVVSLHPLHTVPKRTPAAFGFAFDDIRFETADGVKLAAWVVPHADARGSVIFCHGHGRNRGHVAGLLQTFHDLGLNVIAFDFRGHGESEGHTTTFGHREGRDLLAAAAYVRERFPGKPVFLAGVSLGAAVILQTLPELPDVLGVWSEGCFSHMTDAIECEFSWLPTAVRKPLVSLYHVFGLLDCGFWAPAVSPIQSLNLVNVPIYFVHGEKDELVPFTDGEALYDAYAGAKWHWWVENASHYDVRQRHRDEYLERLRAFFEDRFSAVEESRACGD
jgi:fermentation-respiration switch protein FrsA (DUF1100 family)